MTAGISPDAILGAVVVVGVFGLGALWKLATMLAEVRGQVRHNGGSTLKDDARTAATEAVAARKAADIAKQLAEQVAVDLERTRIQHAKSTGQQLAATKQVQHDVTNLRTGQELLLALQDRLGARVDRLDADRLTRDKALGDALHESLDVALLAADAKDGPTP